MNCKKIREFKIYIVVTTNPLYRCLTTSKYHTKLLINMQYLAFVSKVRPVIKEMSKATRRLQSSGIWLQLLYWWGASILEEPATFMKMKVAGCSKTLIRVSQTIQCHIPEGCNFHIYCCENLKSPSSVSLCYVLCIVAHIVVCLNMLKPAWSDLEVMLCSWEMNTPVMSHM